MINVTRSSMPEFEEYCEEIKELWDSRWLTNMGAKHKQFETDLKDYLHTENVCLYCNGHLALENISLRWNLLVRLLRHRLHLRQQLMLLSEMD